MTRAILLAEDYVTEQEVVEIVYDGGKAFVIRRYDSISERWVEQTVNAVRMKPMPGQTWEELKATLTQLP